VTSPTSASTPGPDRVAAFRRAYLDGKLLGVIDLILAGHRSDTPQAIDDLAERAPLRPWRVDRATRPLGAGSGMRARRCVDCGEPVLQHGVGRPRIRCEACRHPQEEAS
jgi:hypothetical protein